MMCFLMKQIIFTLQCLCKLWLSIVIFIQIHQEVYGSLKELRFLLVMLIWVLTILNHLNIKQFFKYKTEHATDWNSFVENTKIVVPWKYLSNFWRSLEMTLINCKIHLEWNWIEDCILSSAVNSAKFKIMDDKLHVPMVTLSTKDNVNLKKQVSDVFKRSVN